MQTKAIDQWTRELPIIARRGEIADRNGVTLVGNEDCYSVFVRARSVENAEIVCSAKKFKGVKHRIEHVKTIGGVDYYNDSKATNVDATVKAIDAMVKPTILILGGKDKGLDYCELFEKIKRSQVKSVVITGESRFRMLDSAKEVGYEKVSVVEDFYLAIDIASLIAKDGDCVLFSPACSSYDKFTDFEQRGNCFIEYLEKIVE